MALLFCDGFDHYDDDYEAKKWGLSNQAAIATTGGRRNGGYMTGSGMGSTDYIGVAIPNTGTVIVGAALKGSTSKDDRGSFYRFKDDATTQVEMRMYNIVGTLCDLAVYSNSVLLGATTGRPFNMDIWQYVEMKVYFHETAGTVEIKIDGTTKLSLTSQDTQVSANAYCNSVNIVWAGYWITVAQCLDDFYICDTSGSTCNDFLGDIKVVSHFPDADGTYTDFVPSTGSDHYALVDDPLVNITDYNDGDALNEIDSYGITAPSDLGTIYGVQITSMLSNPDVGTRKVKNLLRSNSTDYLGSNELTLSTTWQMVKDVWDVDPYDSAAWTKTKLDAIEIGVKVTV